jgi:uncharacterized protein (TIGR02145 family)
MPDNKWWLAQNVKYAKTGVAATTSGCTPEKCGRLYTGSQMSSTYTGSIGASGYGAGKQGICPNNWILPVVDNWQSLTNAIDPVTLSDESWCRSGAKQGTSLIVTVRLAATNNPLISGNDYYGWANGSHTIRAAYCIEGWRGNDEAASDGGLMLGHALCDCSHNAKNLFAVTPTANNQAAPVRCLRQL